MACRATEGRPSRATWRRLWRRCPHACTISPFWIVRAARPNPHWPSAYLRRRLGQGVLLTSLYHQLVPAFPAGVTIYQTVRFCWSCGCTRDGSAAFCSGCGMRIDGAAADGQRCAIAGTGITGATDASPPVLELPTSADSTPTSITTGSTPIINNCSLCKLRPGTQKISCITHQTFKSEFVCAQCCSAKCMASAQEVTCLIQSHAKLLAELSENICDVPGMIQLMDLFDLTCMDNRFMATRCTESHCLWIQDFGPHRPRHQLQSHNLALSVQRCTPKRLPPTRTSETEIKNVYVYVRTCTHVHTYTQTNAYICILTRTYMYTYMYVCTYQ